MKPGVAIERVDASRIPPIVLRTDVAALVGTAERGPLDTPVVVESMRQFTTHFGTFLGTSYLAYAVRAFFENGGLRCWIVRVAAPEAAQTAVININDETGAYALKVEANSPGTWGNGLTLEWSISGRAVISSAAGASTLQYSNVSSVSGFSIDDLIRIEQGTTVQYRVIADINANAKSIYWIHPDPLRRRAIHHPLTGFEVTKPIRFIRIAYGLNVRERGTVVASYSDLHLVSTHPRYMGAVLPPNQLEPIVITFPEADPAKVPLPLDVPFDAALQLANGGDGLTLLQPSDFFRGLQSLAEIDEIALVAAPDLLIQPERDPDYAPIPAPKRNPCVPCPPKPPPRNVHQPKIEGEMPPIFTHEQIAQAQAAMIDLCEAAGDRFAIISLPFDIATAADRSRDDAIAWRELFGSRCAALYAPWISVSDPRNVSPTRLIPPCGSVVGAIARNDLTFGVQQAPGNINLSGVTAIARTVNDDLHSDLNDANINVVRAEYGRTPIVGGARTLSYEAQWRYINIVRLTLTIKKAADLALRWVVFEPNDDTLRSNVRATLTAIMKLFYSRGAFAGDSEATSYYVRCDDVLNPPEARELGQLTALVGFAPATPAEFIIIRVGKQFNAPAVSLFAPTELTA